MNNKYKELENIIDKYTKGNVVVAFSGGVDSSLILKMCKRLSDKNKTKLFAVTFVTDLQPTIDLSITKKVAKEIGADHYVLNLDQLSIDDVKNNSINRCYSCKKTLFTSLLQFAKQHNSTTVIEGSNADDLLNFRPGLKAIKELEIKSPLIEANLTKKDIREIAQNLGLSVAKRPSSPCLATRFHYNDTIDLERINMVEKAEEYINTKYSGNNRVRIQGKTARIETSSENFISLIDSREQIVKYFKLIGFEYITFDLEGFRSGSMDINIKNK